MCVWILPLAKHLDRKRNDWLVVLRFNATLTAQVLSWRSVTHICFLAFFTPVLAQISFQSHRLLFSHASAEVRGEHTPERNFASTGDRTHNHQVMSPTRSPLSHPGGAENGMTECHLHNNFHTFIIYSFPKRQILDSSKLKEFADDNFKFDAKGRKFFKWIENTAGKGEIARYEQFLLFPQCLQSTCTEDT